MANDIGDPVAAGAAEAQAALASFVEGPAREAAEQLSRTFEAAGERIGRALGRAAVDGEASFKRLAKTILEELARVALAQVFGQGASGIGSFLNAGVGALASSPAASPFSTFAAPRSEAGPVSVHFHFVDAGGGETLLRHQGQIAAQVARAVAYGRRNL